MSTDAADASEEEMATAGYTGGATGGVRVWFEQTWAFTARTIITLRNNYVMVLLAVGFPPLFYLMTAASASLEPGIRVANAVTWGMFGALFAAMYVFGNQLATDVEDQRYVTYRSMPIYPSAEFVGRIVGGLLIATLAMLAGLAAGLVDGASIRPRGPSSVLVVPLAFALVCTLFMMVALPVVILLEDESYVDSTTSLVAILFFFVTGQNGMVAGTAWIDTHWLNYIPNSLGTRLVASHFVPADQWAGAGLTPPSMPEGVTFLALVAVYGLFALVVGFAFFRTVLYRLEVRA